MAKTTKRAKPAHKINSVAAEPPISPAPPSPEDQRTALTERVQAVGGAFLALLHEIGGTDPNGDALASRHLALAYAHVEDAINRAVRHLYQ